MASEYDVLLDEPVAAQAKSGPSEYDALLHEPAAAAPEKAQPWYYPAAAVQAVKNIGQGFQRSVQDVANAPTLPEKILRTVGGAAGNLFNIPMQAGNAFLSSIPGVNRLNDQAIGGMFSRVPVPGTSGTVGDVAQGAQYEAQQHPRLMANLGAAANITGVLPVGRMVSGAADALKAADLGSMAPKVSLTELDKAIQKGVDKGIKPTVVGKPSFTKLDEFYSKANDAVKTIAENKDALKLVDENGEAIPRPRSATEMAQAITQTKKIIYDKYHDMAVNAGDAGAQFDSQPVISKLDQIAQAADEELKPGDPRLKYAPETRAYAASLKGEISELHGAPPDVIEARIADLNNSLKGFYEGRVSKAKAQIDGSIAQSMREELDDNIMQSQGEGYQDLKNQYGALKSVENEVSKRALVNARRATKGAFDLTDVFTGGELVGGLLTGNPLAVAKGATGIGIKTAWKALNDPDRYINNMFDKAWKYEPNQNPEGLKDLLSLKNRSGSIGGTDITPAQQAPGSARQQIIDETLPDNANARNAAQVGYQRAQDAYARAQALLKNRAGSIGGMAPLNDVEGNQIAQNLGVKYNGIQQGFGRAPGGYMFTNTEPEKESTFLARTAEEAGIGLKKTRKLYGNQAGSIGGMEAKGESNIPKSNYNENEILSRINKNKTSLEKYIADTKEKQLGEQNIKIETSNEPKKYDFADDYLFADNLDKIKKVQDQTGNEHSLEFFERKRQELEDEIPEITEKDIENYKEKFNYEWGMNISKEKAAELLKKDTNPKSLDKWVSFDREHKIFKNGNDYLMNVNKNDFTGNSYYKIPEKLLNRKSMPETSWNMFKEIEKSKNEEKYIRELSRSSMEKDYEELKKVRSERLINTPLKDGWKVEARDLYQGPSWAQQEALSEKDARKLWGDNFTLSKNVPVVLTPNGGIYKTATTSWAPYGKRNISVSDFEKEFKSNLSASEQKTILKDLDKESQGSAPMRMLGLTAGISGAAGAAGLALERRKKKTVGNMKAK